MTDFLPVFFFFLVLCSGRKISKSVIIINNIMVYRTNNDGQFKTFYSFSSEKNT